jgi:hypothetical protein
VGNRIPAEDSRVLAAFTAQLALAIEQRVLAESFGPEERGVSRGTQ